MAAYEVGRKAASPQSAQRAQRKAKPNTSNSAWLKWLLALLAGGLLLAGCYRENPPTPGAPADLPPPPNLRTEPVQIDGSALMQPFVTQLGVAFQHETPNTTVTVGASGTRTGFAHFCEGVSPLHNALRAITAEEAQACAAQGIAYAEVILAYDVAAVVVPAENTFADCLSRAQLDSIWRANSAVQSWRQVNLAYPDLPLAVYAPAEDSLAFTLFEANILGGGAMRPARYEGVPVGPEAIGFLSLSEAQALGASLRIVSLDASDLPNAPAGNCLPPQDTFIYDGGYALARPLRMYVNSGLMQARPEIAAFLRFVLGPDGGAIAQVAGLYPASEADQATNLARLGLAP